MNLNPPHDAVIFSLSTEADPVYYYPGTCNAIHGAGYYEDSFWQGLMEASLQEEAQEIWGQEDEVRISEHPDVVDECFCPDCNSLLINKYNDFFEGFQVICTNCGLYGPVDVTRKGALADFRELNEA